MHHRKNFTTSINTELPRQRFAWQSGDALQLPKVVNLVAGHLVNDPIDRKAAVLRMRQRDGPFRRRQPFEERQVHARDGDESLSRRRTRQPPIERDPFVLIEALSDVPWRYDRHPRASSERKLGLRQMRQYLTRRPLA